MLEVLEVLEVLDNKGKENKRQNKYAEQEKISETVHRRYDWLYRKSEKGQPKLLEIISNYRKLMYKVNIEKSIAFLNI